MDGLRGLAVVAVVLLHAELTAGPLPWLAEVNHELAPYRMPLLVALSGVLLGRSLAKGAHRHLAGKVRGIAWPYLLWATADVLHVLADAHAAGRPAPWDWLLKLFYDPQTYLWFLAYLFCYHVLATPLPPWLRTLAGPVLVLAADGLDYPELHRFVELAGWFLIGDALAREVGPRVPAPIAGAVGRLRWGVLALIGRQSIVFYACHLLVMVYAVRLLRHLGVSDPQLLVPIAVGVPLAVGALLVHGRRHPWVAVLFAWPAVDSRTGNRPVRQPGAAGNRSALEAAARRRGPEGSTLAP